MFKKLSLLFLTVTIVLPACGTLEISIYQTPVPESASTGPTAMVIPEPTQISTGLATETPPSGTSSPTFSDVSFYTISTDFPMAQKRRCAAGVDKVKVVSDVLEADFGIKYGLLIKERRYLRRAVFIVGRDGKLTYVKYMPVLAEEPNYDEVISAAKDALK